jgi:hypothetical protein
MRNKWIKGARLIAGLLCALAVLAMADSARAQAFTASKGDLLLGFRKTGGSQFELVVNIGNATNFLAISPGTTVNVSNFSPTQLTAAFPTYNNLQWSVSGAFQGSTAWAGFPPATIWSTLARANTNVQSTPPLRLSSSSQQATRNRVVSVGSGANTISLGLGATNSNNYSVLVRESTANADPNILSVFLADPSDSNYGDYQGTWYLVETVTPSSFTQPQRADLYQSVPDGLTDPISNQGTGNAYYVGYFQFNPAGTMTFTRASVTPPAPTITLQRSGNVSTISFLSASGFSYSLYYTNAANLTASRTNWATPGTTVTGDGSTKSFTDTTTAPDRVYSVKAQ